MTHGLTPQHLLRQVAYSLLVEGYGLREAI